MLEYEISPHEAYRLISTPSDEKPVLLDVREPHEFAAARVSGSLLMPMGVVSQRAHEELDPDQLILVLCHHGVRSMNVAVWPRDLRRPNPSPEALTAGPTNWTPPFHGIEKEHNDYKCN
jgi:rhodanese-related sulfurtransferase